MRENHTILYVDVFSGAFISGLLLDDTTSWFKLNVPRFFRNERRLQYLLHDHVSSITLPYFVLTCT